MRWKTAVVLVVLGFGWVETVWAADIRLRALSPNPLGADTGEWIAVENTGSATVSAGLYLIQDTVGSVKTHALAGFKPYELMVVTASESGITLNNTKEGVELWSDGVKVEASPEFATNQEGVVFVQLDDGWHEMSEDEFLERAEKRNWLQVAATVAEPTPSPLPSVSSAGPTPSPTISAENVTEPEESRSLINYTRHLPILSRASPSASVSEFPDWPQPPEPDYEKEMAVFLEWKRQALFGSLALLFGGWCWLLLVLPSPLAGWRWLKDEFLL